MRYRILFICLALLLTSSTLSARDSTFTKQQVNLGLNFSTISGVGLAWGFTASKSTTIQVTVLALATHSGIFLSFGFESQFHLVHTPLSRLYVGPAVGLYVSDNTTNINGGIAMGGAVSSGAFNNRLFFSGTIYYPAMYSSNKVISIGAGVGFYFVL